MRKLHIVGGGLAGLSLGIRLRDKGIPVKVTEAGSYPRHRVCGEFISGVSQETLCFLGIEDLVSSGHRCLSTSWYSRRGKFFETDLPTPATALSRFTLDKLLADRFVEKGGVLEINTRHVQNTTNEEGTIVASGRHRDPASPWLGLKCHLEDLPLENDLEMHLGENGYLGLCRIENGRTNACGLFRLRPGLSLNKETAVSTYLKACGLDELAERIENSKVDPNSCVAVNAFHFRGRPKSDQGELRIGDRYSMIGPFTGNGMSIAFQSAAIVAPTLEQYSGENSSWKNVMAQAEHQLRSAFHRRLRMARFFHPFLLRPEAQPILINLAKSGLLPFRSFLRSVR